jgi:hypothetical protein
MLPQVLHLKGVELKLQLLLGIVESFVHLGYLLDFLLGFEVELIHKHKPKLFVLDFISVNEGF